MAFDGVQVADIERDILGFDIGRLQMDYIEVLRELDNVTRIFQRTVALATVEIGDVRWPTDADEGDVIPAQDYIFFFHRTVYDKFARCGFENLRYYRRVDMHHLGRLVNRRPGLFKVASGFLVEHSNPEFLDDSQGGLVDRLQSILRKRGLSNQRVFQRTVVDIARRSG